MDIKNKSQQMVWSSVCRLLILFLTFPTTIHAHLLSITATTPFPSTVAASSLNTATFTVTNIAAKINIAPINQSYFPNGSGLSILSSTCDGVLLTPGQSCTVQVSLQATSAGQIVSGELRMRASPALGSAKFPIQVTVGSGLPTITIQPVINIGLPAIREPVIAQNSGNWLIVGGSTGNFHDFNTDFINTLYVYNPSTFQQYSISLSSTDLPTAVKKQLNSSDSEFLQDGDTLYIIGGFYTADNNVWTTLNTITAINIPSVINAIEQGSTSLSQFVYTNSTIPQFKVTGGQLGKIGNYFYLAFGQDCEGSNYCTTQVYTDSIFQFSTDPTLSSITIIDSVTHPDLDGSGWRRRDYTLAPLMSGNTETLFAMGGPFTASQTDALVWTNGIVFNGNIEANDNFINQQANEYLSALLSMYSANRNLSYVATFSSLSNLYWAPSGLVNDPTTPYGNILDLISIDASGNTQEYANLTPMCSGQPLATCLYMGLGAQFIPINNYYDNRHILQLDQLPQNTPTLVGYIYGGLVSTGQDIFGASPNYSTNQVYEVYVTPANAGAANWQNITNLYPGN